MSEEEYMRIFNSKNNMVKLYQSGDAFGELALLTQNPRAATLECKKDTYLLEMSKQGFDLLVSSYVNQVNGQKIHEKAVVHYVKKEDFLSFINNQGLLQDVKQEVQLTNNLIINRQSEINQGFEHIKNTFDNLLKRLQSPPKRYFQFTIQQQIQENRENFINSSQQEQNQNKCNQTNIFLKNEQKSICINKENQNEQESDSQELQNNNLQNKNHQINTTISSKSIKQQQIQFLEQNNKGNIEKFLKKSYSKGINEQNSAKEKLLEQMKNLKNNSQNQDLTKIYDVNNSGFYQFSKRLQNQIQQEQRKRDIADKQSSLNMSVLDITENGKNEQNNSENYQNNNNFNIQNQAQKNIKEKDQHNLFTETGSYGNKTAN
ncbi:Cyclic nucleotide-binding protein [Pseudocohnilembus persalinus]|uniref:Cyclic nucleotide-binding protein n=1 Tax=Pseudocohnilembus persalinus TaxID=266149 RepID=A0A0V0QZQ4_PSEPJ|nr:Cyclic nucleotide-binding protein [Pseudocohnilembus persalinus]|eukprot:KRX07762.1 Cyclic nucleotide-binding protein [Pseudocohnilembus persalinus]